jgi:hypothetical protein
MMIDWTLCCLKFLYTLHVLEHNINEKNVIINLLWSCNSLINLLPMQGIQFGKLSDHLALVTKGNANF